MRIPSLPVFLGVGLLGASLLVDHVFAADGRALFNGRDFADWEWVVSPAAPIDQALSYGSDGVVVLAGKPTSFIQTATAHRNFSLHVEWRWPAGTGNGGILVHIASGPKDRQWPVSIQVQTKHGAAGDVLPMAGARFTESLDPNAKTPQRLRLVPAAERPVGEWNTADVVCRDGTLEVTINGVVQNRVTGLNPDQGRIGFQFEGIPYEVRHVRLTDLP